MNKKKFELDKTGFPMLWVEPIKAYLHWLPVTKIQFETYMCAAPDSHFNAEWYDEILAMNPRISPSQIRLSNYWQAFLTGIKPSEVQRFARWNGEGYQIPTLEEWFESYKYLKSLPPEDDPISQIGGIKDRILKLITHLNDISPQVMREVGYTQSLADQMFLRMGVMEWIEGQNQQYQWGGMGETYPKFHGILFTPDHGQPRLPNNPEEYRLPYYGLRLIWRPV